jgi:hypothetical protein
VVFTVLAGNFLFVEEGTGESLAEAAYMTIRPTRYVDTVLRTSHSNLQVVGAELGDLIIYEYGRLILNLIDQQS